MKTIVSLCLLLQLFFVGVVVGANNAGIYDANGAIQQPSPTQSRKREPDIRLMTYARDLKERQITNAERLRKRMPILPPSRRTQALYPRQSSSGGPCNPMSRTGKLAVYDSTGVNKLGYVNKAFDGQNSYTRTTSSSNALTVQLPVSPSIPFEMTATNGPDSSHPFVGLVGGSGGYNFKTGQLGFAYLAGTGHTNSGSTPSSSAGTSFQALGYNGPAESTVYSINCATRELSATWINADSTIGVGTFFYDGNVDFLGVVGDFAKFKTTYPGDNSVLQRIFFEPI